jgi:hypothetical protein
MSRLTPRLLGDSCCLAPKAADQLTKAARLVGNVRAPRRTHPEDLELGFSILYCQLFVLDGGV